MLAAVAAVGVSLPERPASAQLQAVPRAGFTFTDQLTERVNVESIDTASRTGIFVLPDGRWLNLSIADSVPGIDKINDGSIVNITYTEVVTILNLKRKGVGSQGSAQRLDVPVQPNRTRNPYVHLYRGRCRPRRQHDFGDQRRKRPGPYLSGDGRRPARIAEGHEGRRRAYRHDDAAHDHGDHAGQLTPHRQVINGLGPAGSGPFCVSRLLLVEAAADHSTFTSSQKPIQ